MSSPYAPNFRGRRFLEVLPGTITWIILISPFILSFIRPYWVAVFVIIFDFYWLLKSLNMGGHLLSGYLHMRRDQRIDWLDRLKRMENFDNYFAETKRLYEKVIVPFSKRKLGFELEELKDLERHKGEIINWQEIDHAVFLAVYKEPKEVLEASIDSLKNSNYPSQKVIIVMAMEERAGGEPLAMARRLKEKYQEIFKDFLIFVHPDGIAGEIKGKGSNLYHSGLEFQKYCDENDIRYDRVIVSAFDCDTRVSPEYLGCVTYKYIINPDRIHRTYQPIPLYSNNIWHVPAINRIVSFGSTFWQMIEATRSYRMVNFSSQAMSFQTLVDINFWDRTIVSEDSKQYYRAFFRYGGNHRCVPILTPVYMDAVQADNLWTTLKNQYLQKRRWAWGVEHFPYLIRECALHKEVPLSQRLVLIYRILNGHISWSTASLLIALVGWIPLILNPRFHTTVIAMNMPTFARNLLILTWIGLVVSAIISTLLLPSRPKNFGRWKTFVFVISWVLVPISAIFFGSIPAIDAQTHLMFKKYLGFWVTPKEART
ncbi:MAG: glycosyltransferase family 2 protein [Candidatus Berkelbacteria bacterium]|nr:glycosyltransferase family 2 protein [Candidatus Berkelbacteria bacterium]